MRGDEGVLDKDCIRARIQLVGRCSSLELDRRKHVRLGELQSQSGREALSQGLRNEPIPLPDKRIPKFVYQRRTEGVDIRDLRAIRFGGIVITTYWTGKAVGVSISLVGAVMHIDGNVEAVLLADVVVQPLKRFLAIVIVG